MLVFRVMLGLRRWHKSLLVSEAVAGLIVIWGYHDIVENRDVLLGGLGGVLVLSPGLKILGWPVDPLYPEVCLLCAGIYTVVLFGLWTFGRWLTSPLLRWARSGSGPRIEAHDLNRYLR